MEFLSELLTYTCVGILDASVSVYFYNLNRYFQHSDKEIHISKLVVKSPLLPKGFEAKIFTLEINDGITEYLYDPL